jgi:hypothetical protein
MMTVGSSETSLAILLNTQSDITEEAIIRVIDVRFSKHSALNSSQSNLVGQLSIKQFCSKLSIVTCPDFVCHTLKIIIICNPVNSNCMPLGKFHVYAEGSDNWFICYHVFQFDKP